MWCVENLQYFWGFKQLTAKATNKPIRIWSPNYNQGLLENYFQINVIDKITG